MMIKTFDPETYIDAMSTTLDLDIHPAHRPGVVLNLTVAHDAVATMAAFALPERTDPAALYHPQAPA
jgi:hypothetical protein